MQFKVLKEDILKYLQYANSFTNPKGLNDILQNIYIEVENNTVNIKATNYQMGFSCFFEPNSVEKEGRVTVSCRKLLDIIKELPDGALIDFQYDDTRLNVICGKSKFKLSTLSSENFPSISDIIPEYFIKIDAANFINLMKRTYFCISNDSTKLEYTGAQVRINRDIVETFATGMQRIAIASTNIDAEYSNDFMINIPKKTITEILRIFEAKGDIEIQTDRKQISFKHDNIIIYSKLIEKFIKNIERLFNNDYPIKAKLDRKSFIDASKFQKSTGSGNLSRVMENIRLVRESGLEVGLNSVIQSDSKEDVKEMVEFALKEELPLKLLPQIGLPGSSDFKQFIFPILREYAVSYSDKGTGAIRWLLEKGNHRTSVLYIDSPCFSHDIKRCRNYSEIRILPDFSLQPCILRESETVKLDFTKEKECIKQQFRELWKNLKSC